MRRALYAVLAFTVAAVALPGVSHAQNRDRNEQQRENDRADAARSGNDDTWNPRQGRLDGRVNAGPCPFVKILYDAARYVELRDNRALPGNVGFTGEIEGVNAACSYRADEPITVDISMLFRLGRGPNAATDGNNYRYWVAVTERDTAVLTKQYFDLPVNFGGADRTDATEEKTLVIPRARQDISGSNFEILIGFDVTPEMVDFNRAGKRFCADASAGDVGTCLPSRQ